MILNETLFLPKTGLLMGWPSFEPLHNFSLKHEIARVASFLARESPVYFIGESSVKREICQVFIELELSIENIFVIKSTSDLVWARDYAPIFITDQAGSSAIGFDFSFWGTQPPELPISREYTGLAKKIALEVGVAQFQALPLLNEQGNLEFGGNTLITCASVFEQRNPGVSRQVFERHVRETTGIQDVIWLPEGLLEDSLPHKTTSIELGDDQTVYFTTGTGGHIDEFCRYMTDSLIALAEVPVENGGSYTGRENAKRLEKSFKVLSHALSAGSQKIAIVRIPTAPEIIVELTAEDQQYHILEKYLKDFNPEIKFDDSVQVLAAASYLNFIKLGNSLVLPQYHYIDSRYGELDEKVRRIFEQVYPGIHILPVNPIALNVDGGGFHCITAPLG